MIAIWSAFTVPFAVISFYRVGYEATIDRLFFAVEVLLIPLVVLWVVITANERRNPTRQS
jgi:hypothetical protein